MNKIYVVFVLAAGLAIAGCTKEDLKNLSNAENSLSKSLTAGNNVPSAANAIATNTNSSTEGLAPVGPVTSPGCSGIEVVGYAQANNANASNGMFPNQYYMAIRNTGADAKIVTIHVVRDPRSWQRQQSPLISIKVLPHDLQRVAIDLSLYRPTSVSIDRCL